MRRQKVAVRQCQSRKLGSTAVHAKLQAVYKETSSVDAQGSGYFRERLRTQKFCMPARSERKITCDMLYKYKYKHKQTDFNRGV